MGFDRPTDANSSFELNINLHSVQSAWGFDLIVDAWVHKAVEFTKSREQLGQRTILWRLSKGECQQLLESKEVSCRQETGKPSDANLDIVRCRIVSMWYGMRYTRGTRVGPSMERWDVPETISVNSELQPTTTRGCHPCVCGTSGKILFWSRISFVPLQYVLMDKSWQERAPGRRCQAETEVWCDSDHRYLGEGWDCRVQGCSWCTADNR